MPLNDIVYFLKEGKNEELRYSLRSVCKNFPYRKIWFYGGKPEGIEPDHYVYVNQYKNKWGNVQMMVKQACMNEEITPNFYIFNDDFFVMKPVKSFHNIYDGCLFKYLFFLENRFGINGSDYIIRMRKMMTALYKYNPKLELKNYATHTPFLVNKEAMLDTFEHFPDIIMYRCLYGNYKQIGGVNSQDVKFHRTDTDEIKTTFVSTSDESFKNKNVGKLIREAFPEPCKYERK